MVDLVDGMVDLIDVNPLTWEGLFCCFLSGLIVGLERQLRGKPVGMRTSALICIGTYVFVAITNTVANSVTDPSRVIGQVVTGIGFLGAGVILARHGAIVGVTSAASVWVLAAIGVVIGIGHCWLGVKLAILTVVILTGVDLVETRFEFLQKGVHGGLGKKMDDEQAKGRRARMRDISE
ncbi:MAG: MgtC/SapB family protein [Sedimentisphaerales bacterium]|nr:MgtC/SapB family protein [Sedimentisphaerales bacterium]